MVSQCNNGVQDFEIENVVVHELYNKPDIFKNDIAIIKLRKAVVRNGTKSLRIVNIQKGSTFTKEAPKAFQMNLIVK